MDFELISFKTCPFVQRSIITLRWKAVPYRVTYIDLADKPDWFTAISPLGKVPVLRIDGPDLDGSEVLFESAVINEYLDEATPGSLLPADPLGRAKARAWIEFGSACLWHCFDMTVAPDAAALGEAVAKARDKLARLEAALAEGPYFLGEEFSLVDAAYAPFLMWLALTDEWLGVLVRTAGPRLAAWSDQVLGLEAVRGSVLPEHRDLMIASIHKRRAQLSSLLPGQPRDDGVAASVY